jgi:hypothetical protein
MSQSGLVEPKSITGPTSLDVYADICQPVYDEFLSGWTCCGTPAVSSPGLSFRVCVIGTDGLPMTGISVEGLVLSGNVSLDQSTYVTDGNGCIYPSVYSHDAPTRCGPPSNSGSVALGSAQLIFYVVGYPYTQGYASLQVHVSTYGDYTFNTAGEGLECGSC